MPHMLVIESNTGDEFAVEHRLQCSRWRSQAVYMDSMRGIADISNPEHDQPASRGSCNVHLSWQQQRTGRKSMMTVCSSWRNAAALLLLCLLAIPGQSQAGRVLHTALQAPYWVCRLAAPAGTAHAQGAHAESAPLQMSFSAQHWEGLLAILACSDRALRQVVQRWPGIAELTVGDVMHRLLCLKVSLHPKSCSGTRILSWRSAVAEG